MLKWREDQKGFTLLELVIAFAILVPALLTVIAASMYLQRGNALSREVITAYEDANMVVDRLRNISQNGLGEVTRLFPPGAVAAGFNNLDNERVVVNYADPGADPLDVTVTTTWQSNGRNNVSRQLRTWLTQRR